MRITINGAVLLYRPEWPDVDFAVEQSREGIVAKVERVGEPKLELRWLERPAMVPDLDDEEAEG